MPDPTLKVQASEQLLGELVAAQAALRRTRGASREAPKLDALIVNLYRLRAAVPKPQLSLVPSDGPA
jgi:hypothetical protein